MPLRQLLAAAAAAAAGDSIAYVPIDWKGIVVIITLFFALIVMGLDAIGPDLVFGALTAVYMVSGILTVKEGAAGFANTGVLTVMALYIVAEGVSQTGGLDILLNKVLGRASSVFWAQVRMMLPVMVRMMVRMMLPVMVASAFLNNTPIVALLIPILLSWSRRCNVPAKKLLIPLSFATVLGGTCTIIGTSTNLVVSGLQAEMAKKDPTVPVFGFFTITPYGVPYAIWGMAYIIIFSFLLPGHEGSGHTDLTTELLVSEKSAKAAGSTAGAAGLLEPVGTSKVIAVRTSTGRVAAPVLEDTPIAIGDVIVVQGSAQDNNGFATRNGLQVLVYEGADSGAVSDDAFEAGSVVSSDEHSSLIQVTVAPGGDIVGKNIRDTGFRGRFGAAVIAVKRKNVKQTGRIGDIVLQKGDILVLSAGEGFDAKGGDFSKNFKKLKPLDQAVQREYTTVMRVVGGSLPGKSIQAAGLRGVTGLFLFEVHRADGDVLRAVGPDTLLEANDLLLFAGDIASATSRDIASVSFLLKFDGLAHQQQEQVEKLETHQQEQVEKLETHQVDRMLVQAVVSPHSPLVHKSVRDVRFRHTYGGALLSVHRSGSAVTGDVAAIKLQAGDVLLLETGPEFNKVFAHSPVFALISTVPNSSPVKRNRMWLALALVAALVATQIAEGASGKDILHLWPGSILVAGAMLATKCMNSAQARASMDWEVYICIAFAFGVSTAMEKTNVALGIAEVFAALSRRIGGQTAALTCIYIVTALLSELLTNNAAAAIMFPIAAELAKKLAINMDMMSIAVMLGGSAGWVLPYSYQCNLMVMAAGGYRTKDFATFGAPFHLWLLLGVILILGSGKKVYIPLIATGIFLALVILLPLIYEAVLTPAQRATVRRVLAPRRRRRAAATAAAGADVAAAAAAGGGAGAAPADAKDVAGGH
ncbi:MAG: putative sodium/sulfate cotransporter 3 [Monoraphidium minutum]|nr:MAG: putative sodium/sulfate cotransporter 3 [Monoraphidium minutum]